MIKFSPFRLRDINGAPKSVRWPLTFFSRRHALITRDPIIVPTVVWSVRQTSANEELYNASTVGERAWGSSHENVVRSRLIRNNVLPAQPAFVPGTEYRDKMYIYIYRYTWRGPVRCHWARTVAVGLPRSSGDGSPKYILYASERACVCVCVIVVVVVVVVVVVDFV